MITRRRFLEHSALAPATLACRSLSLCAAEGSTDSRAPVHLAIIGSTYHYGSELQTLADRFLVGYPHEGDWHMPNVQVVSMYVERRPSVESALAVSAPKEGSVRTRIAGRRSLRACSRALRLAGANRSRLP